MSTFLISTNPGSFNHARIKNITVNDVNIKKQYNQVVSLTYGNVKNMVRMNAVRYMIRKAMRDLSRLTIGRNGYRTLQYSSGPILSLLFINNKVTIIVTIALKSYSSAISKAVLPVISLIVLSLPFKSNLRTIL